MQRSDERVPPQISELQIPAQWWLSRKDKVTLNVPGPLNEKIEQLANELRMTKSQLYILGGAYITKILSDWLSKT